MEVVLIGIDSLVPSNYRMLCVSGSTLDGYPVALLVELGSYFVVLVGFSLWQFKLQETEHPHYKPPLYEVLVQVVNDNFVTLFVREHLPHIYLLEGSLVDLVQPSSWFSL